MRITDLIKIAKSLLRGVNFPDRAYTSDDLIQEMVLVALESKTKYKGKAKLSTFLYTIMKNHLLNLIVYGNYRNHVLLDETIPVPSYSVSSKLEELDRNEQTIARDIIMLFDNGADLREVKKQFQNIYRKEWKEMQAKVRAW